MIHFFIISSYHRFIVSNVHLVGYAGELAEKINDRNGRSYTAFTHHKVNIFLKYGKGSQ